MWYSILFILIHFVVPRRFTVKNHSHFQSSTEVMEMEANQQCQDLLQKVTRCLHLGTQISVDQSNPLMKIFFWGGGKWYMAFQVCAIEIWKASLKPDLLKILSYPMDSFCGTWSASKGWQEPRRVHPEILRWGQTRVQWEPHNTAARRKLTFQQPTSPWLQRRMLAGQLGAQAKRPATWTVIQSRLGQLPPQRKLSQQTKWPSRPAGKGRVGRTGGGLLQREASEETCQCSSQRHESTSSGWNTV